MLLTLLIHFLAPQSFQPNHQRGYSENWSNFRNLKWPSGIHLTMKPEIPSARFGTERHCHPHVFRALEHSPRGFPSARFAPNPPSPATFTSQSKSIQSLPKKSDSKFEKKTWAVLTYNVTIATVDIFTSPGTPKESLLRFQHVGLRSKTSQLFVVQLQGFTELHLQRRFTKFWIRIWWIGASWDLKKKTNKINIYIYDNICIYSNMMSMVINGPILSHHRALNGNSTDPHSPRTSTSFFPLTFQSNTAGWKTADSWRAHNTRTIRNTWFDA